MTPPPGVDDSMKRLPVRGRGASHDPPNRFETLAVERDAWVEAEDPGPRTVFYRDASRSAISWNRSPDLPFDASLNPYRGCEHGCIYCYARPTHEYLGFSAGLDFESRIMVKRDAPDLLRSALASRRWKPQVLLLSGVTDPYQPVERRLGITRRCLEVLVDFRNPVVVLTKNHMITRDVDLLSELAALNAVTAALSVTTLRNDLHHVMEPRTSIPARRIDAIRRLADAGIPVGVNVAPVIPGLTDEEIPAILEAAAAAGASHAALIVLRLPLGVAPLFEEWLGQHFPERKDKVLNRVRSMGGGVLYDARFGTRMRGSGPFADQIGRLFELTRSRLGLDRHPFSLSTEHFTRPAASPDQLGLFP